ncbi:MAG TPA: pyridine nucleotide-disulfide oxidoreductase [Polyangia bacterium]|nr:pyridine nucleotide-disulfide oxidoreductase [Polyangia bacterium]
MTKHSQTLDTLGIEGFSFADLFQPERLADLYRRWEEGLRAADPGLHERYVACRAHSDGAPPPRELSELLLAVAPHVSEFLARLFGVNAERREQMAATEAELVVFRFKDEFVKRRALKRSVSAGEGGQALAAAIQAGQEVLERAGLAADQQDDERQVARVVCRLLDEEAALKQRPVDDPELVSLRADLARLEAWVVARRGALAARWISYRLPHTLDYGHLVELRRPDAKLPEAISGPPEKRRERDGFRLTDRRMKPTEVLDQVDYCLYCHDRDKDSCSKGLHDAKTGAIKPNPLGIPLNGCPLDEKISEMHLMKRHGDVIAALALACIDNPMLPGTGHRICNDCMKSCIYQKQEPVNIPQIETAVLTDVLALRWGVEIYGLLTRWNPLNLRRPYALPYNGKNVLVVGLGPAGYTLAHHLLNEGFGVIGIDGLKIEPPPMPYAGRPGRPDSATPTVPPAPVERWTQLETELDERVLAGFGGVSEYGITVRWDKNFLTLLHLTLARRERLRMYGGIRLGGTLKLEDVWALGCDHVAICVGAGRPTIVDFPNNLVRGIRKASDFLMALQLTGAYKRSSLANLQVRLPALVIGGGLTAIDTATELVAYYVVQVEKVLERYERLVGIEGEAAMLGGFDAEERAILAEQLEHGRAVRAERERAAREGRAPRFNELVDAWGGVAILYRKNLADSPAYRLNHEEVDKCLEEGVRFVERMAPKRAEVDEYGALRALVGERQAETGGKWRATGELVEFPARTLCVAAGTSPNTVYEKEHPGTFRLDKSGYFLPHRAVRGPEGAVTLEPHPEGFFTSYLHEGRTVTYYGDNHPRFAGSVVKAMASAKKGLQAIVDLFAPELAGLDAGGREGREQIWSDLVERVDEALIATVYRVNRLTPTIVEVVVRAPFAAEKFQPGQFYRLQNYEVDSPVVEGTRLSMEGIALTGAWTDPELGLLSLIVLELGGSSRLCAHLKEGQRVVVMGPTGAPTEIPRGETVLLAGGGLGNAVLFSIGRALRNQGNRVLYFAGYRLPRDVYKRQEIEVAADQVVWSTDVAPAMTPRRPQDLSFVGNVVEAMVAYAERRFGGEHFSLGEVDRIIAIGSDRMMAAVQRARHTVLGPHLKPTHHGIASINSPMQCMMKEVCAQCLQRHVDPRTGKETIVFSCFNQDQDMDQVDFANLAGRLRQNTVHEKLTARWLTYVLGRGELRGV